MNITKQDSLICLGLFALSVGLRFWHIDHLGLTHFDEGAYAMTGRWLATFGREGWVYHPGHAPGLFPTLVGVSFFIFGIHDTAAIAVSAVAGSLTVSLLYIIGRIWFNRRVALLAALLLATAEYHLIYSRMVLTDVLFSFLFLAAVAALFRGLQSKQRHWFIYGGIATGLCWLTKYHGFFPLLLTGSWMAGTTVLDYIRGKREEALNIPWRMFAFAAVLAILIYLPWSFFVQFTVGYGQILNNTLTHSLGSGPIIITPPGVLLFHFSSWLTSGLLITSVIGIGIGLFKKDRFACYLIFVLCSMMTATMLYFSFPRLSLPVIPILCLLSAIGVHGVLDIWPQRSTLLYPLAGVSLIFWNLFAAWPLLNLSTDAYEKAGVFMRSIQCPQITQMNKNFYFYEASPSIEMRKHEIADLDTLLVQATDCIIFSVDPIIERLPEYQAWFEKKRPQCELIYEIEIEMVETNYYQGIDPRRGDRPLSQSPFIPGESKIRVYRMSDTSHYFKTPTYQVSGRP